MTDITVNKNDGEREDYSYFNSAWPFKCTESLLVTYKLI
jgi:hypothetical protein